MDTYITMYIAHYSVVQYTPQGTWMILYSLPDINKAIQYSKEMVRYSVEDVRMGLEYICIATGEK